MRLFLFLLLFPFSLQILASQNLYFPLVTGDAWETVDPGLLGWCADRVDSLVQFVEAANSKSFIILKDGRIAIERYFDAYTRDSLWYWASAGKSLMAFITGLAREDGYLNIEDTASDYLGKGWTVCAPEDEDQIEIIHQLTMTTGLDDSQEQLGGSEFCLEPECLLCLAAPGARWAYHNAPYRLLQDVVEAAAGIDLNIYTRLRLGNFIGMRGFWFNYIYFSNARDMARFGLLVLNRGVWGNIVIMEDTTYFNSMVRSSQTLNPSYGYLWWLNGQPSFKLPGLQIDFPGPILPEAPPDLIAALGRNDQKIYIVPSEGLVVVRQGASAGGIIPAASSFDNQLWAHISSLKCGTVAARPAPRTLPVELFPNPSADLVTVKVPTAIEQLTLWDSQGRRLRQSTPKETQVMVDLRDLPKGVYLLQVYTQDGMGTARVVKE